MLQGCEKINSILKKNKDITIDGLAKLNGKSVFKTRQKLLEYLNYEIENLPANVNPKNCKHIYKGFKCLDNLCTTKEQDQVLNGLVKIKKTCNKRIEQNKLVSSIFKKLLNIIDVSLYNIKFSDENNVKKSELLYYIIYSLKNANYFYELIKTFPDYATIKDNNGYVLEKIVDDYINLTKAGKYSFDLIYLEKIIKIFINNNKFKSDNNFQTIVLNKLKTHLRDSKKASFFINEIIDDIVNPKLKTKSIDDIAYKYNIDTNPCKSTIDLTNEVINFKKSLLDLREYETITIDGPTTYVYDDAISYSRLDDKREMLIVLVADVATYIEKNSIIDNLAKNISETVYIPRNSLTMLPQSITDKLTLKANEDRTALGHFFIFEDKKIVDFKIERCLINVNKNYSYNEVTNSLNSTTNLEELEFLTNLAELCLNLYDNSGNRLEYRTQKLLKKEVNGIKTYDQSLSSLMIMEFMTLVNNYIAAHFAKHLEVPFIFRANTTYSNDVLNTLVNKSDSSCIEEIKKLNRKLGTFSFYTPYNIPHTGLNLESYCHSTNPLRNYASLECQRIIIDYFINNYVPENFDERFKEIKNLCDYMNSRLEANSDFKEECKTYRPHINR